MRWGCPHCGVNLAISDDKLGSGWSFSRCYKCGGFALVRRAEVNLVKVDRAPAGEHIVLPEAVEDSSTMLSEEATQKLARYRKENAEKAAARPPAIRANNSTANNTGINSNGSNNSAIQSVANALAAGMNVNGMNYNNSLSGGAMNIPSPLPEISPRRLQQRLLPIAIGITATTAVGSGVYLYVQGQALWEKARHNASAEQAETSTVRTASTRSEAVPAQALSARNIQLAASTARMNEIADQLHQNAMAPARNLNTENAAAMNAGNNTQAQSQGSGMMMIEPKIRANLHTGPGINYPVIGTAFAGDRMVVADWNDRWFKVMLEENGKAPKTAWVRTDVVKMIPSKSGDSLPQY